MISLIRLILSFFVASTIVEEFYRGAKVVHVSTGLVIRSQPQAT
jgi:hypothetical protein